MQPISSSKMKPFSIFFIVICLLTPLPSYSDLLEEIIVTAKKREENLQDVSISVTAFSSDVLNDIGLTNSNDLGQFIPGVEIRAVFGNQQAKIWVRGSGATDFHANTQTTVGVYVDEVYLFNTFMQTMQTFDMERIEVLRGPQGTLYGRNATAGAINFITANPTKEFSGYGKVSYGNYDALHLEGAVSGGLTDTLAGRVAFQSSNDDGWMLNRLTGEDVNATDFYSWRAKLEWTPQENLSFLWSVSGSQDRSDSFSYQHVGAADPVTFGRCDGTVRDDCIDFTGYRDPDGFEERGDPTAGDFDLIDEVDNEGLGTSLRVEWGLGNMELTSISSWTKYSRSYAGDDDASPFNLSHNFYDHEVDGWSQELRLASTTDGPWDWLIGIYFSADDLDADNTYLFNTFGNFTTIQTFHQEQESFALFGNTGYQINDKWKINAGLRYTTDDVSLNHESIGGVPATPGGPLPFTFPLDMSSGANTFENTSWKIGLDYTPNEDWLIYASVGTGYKSGGISVGFGDAAEFSPYDKETITAWEGGFKSTLWDGRARLNVSAFYYDYENVQIFDTGRAFGYQVNRLDNVPEATYYGGEAEFIVNPLDGLNLLFGLSYLENELEKYTLLGFFGNPDIVLDGNSNINSPQWKLTGLASYEWATPALMDGKMAASFNWSWTDSEFHTVDNRKEASRKPHWLVGSRLAWLTQDENIEVALWAKNLSDTKYRVESFDLATNGFMTSVPNPPRTFGGEIVYSW